MSTRSQSQSQSHELEKRVGEMLMELNQRHGWIQKQSQELRQDSRVQVARTEARFDELMQLITAMRLQNQDRTTSDETSPAATNGSGDLNNQNLKNKRGKSTRLEFPTFDREGFDGWLMRAEYFFEVADVPATESKSIARGTGDIRACKGIKPMRIGGI